VRMNRMDFAIQILKRLPVIQSAAIPMCSAIIVGSASCQTLDSQNAIPIVFPRGAVTPSSGFFSRAPTVIDFDTLSDGSIVPNCKTISDQCAEMSVTIFQEGEFETRTGSQTDLGSDGISPFNTLAAVDQATELTAILDEPLPTRVDVVFTDGPKNDPFSLITFGADGMEVDRITIDHADNNPQSFDRSEDTFVGVTSDEGIAKVVISIQFFRGPNVRSWEIDDFQFGS